MNLFDNFCPTCNRKYEQQDTEAINHIIYGAFYLQFDLSGHSLAEVQEALVGRPADKNLPVGWDHCPVCCSGQWSQATTEGKFSSAGRLEKIDMAPGANAYVDGELVKDKAARRLQPGERVEFL